MRRLLLIFVVALMALLPLVEATTACAPVLKSGATADIADESALIIWDKATKTQHFIRRASFVTDAADMGFLVPTPSEPEIKKADEEVFKMLEKVTAPKVITKKRDRQHYNEMRYGHKTMVAHGGSAPSRGEEVRVLGEGRVDSLKYAILQATNATALEDWLTKNGYISRPDLRTWLNDYVAKKWIITAFRFEKKPEAGTSEVKPDPTTATELAVSSIRMTFTTNEPFYPYSEPFDQRAVRHHFGGSSGRLLRVFFVGTERVYGSLADGNYWPNSIPWANPLPSDSRTEMLKLLGLPNETAPQQAYLTEFEDRQSPRPATADLQFREGGGGGNVARPPIEMWEEPDPANGPNLGRSFTLLAILGGGFLLVLFLAAFFLWRQEPLSTSRL